MSKAYSTELDAKGICWVGPLSHRVQLMAETLAASENLEYVLFSFHLFKILSLYSVLFQLPFQCFFLPS